MRNPKQIKQFGKRLKALRKKAKMTQATLAYASGLSIRSIYVIENGIQVASLDVILSLAKSLKVTIPEMFEGVEN